jgi:mannitol 2-dehydrogenase
MDELKSARALNLGALGSLPDNIRKPGYKRSNLSAGIVHFGVGNFHRAHMAVYLDELFSMGLNHDWAIIGAGLLQSDAVMRERLKSQDYLTLVVEQDANVSQARVIGPMIDYIAADDRKSLFSWLVNPSIRIVSLTITEGGYFINPATGKFDLEHPDIVYDGAHPDQPKTVFGCILAGLRLRKDKGLAPFTVMSCDNVPHNGVVAKNAVAGLAALSDPEFAVWIRSNVKFPNAMVDRITPATTDRERNIVAERFGLLDASPVFCEEFRQWVIEDSFSSGRPSFEKVGVTFVDDVSPFETMKIRILNGGHAIIAYPGGLRDIHFVHEAMADRQIRAFLDKIEENEIIPIVPPVPNTSLTHYYSQIIRRFSNPTIGDTIRRLCLDGSNRQPKFIVPSIADAISSGGSYDGLVLLSALWCRYCYGISETGQVIEPNDPNWDRLQSFARRAKDEPLAWLEMADVYGNIAINVDFRSKFGDALRAIWTEGSIAIINKYLQE